MRIVLVTHFYPAHGGGIEIVAARLAERLAAGGARLVWCASDADAPPALPGVACDPMRAWNGLERATGFPYPLWSPGSLSRLARHVREADAVHVHDAIYFGSLAAAWLARRHGRRLVVTQHVGEVPLPAPLRPVLALAQRVAAARVLRPAAGVAFVSPRVRQYFEAFGGAHAGWRDVPNGVDEAVFHPDPAATRAALGFDATRPLLLFVGRFVAKKRLPRVRALAAARPGWQCCLVGQGPERPQDWGLPNVRVLAPRPQPELAALYRAADLLLLPSVGEGFPLVVQEAMACGLPAALTAEVAAGGRLPAALWLPLSADEARQPALDLQAIDALLARPAAERAALRAECAAFARRTWSWDAAAAAHRQWLEGRAA